MLKACNQRMFKATEAIILLCPVLVLPCSGLLFACQRGYFLSEISSNVSVCKLCSLKTFMPEDWHTHKECYPCSQIHEPSLEIMVRECNRTHDSDIKCRNGFYRNKEMGICTKCSNCDGHTALPCQDTDTVCCPNTNYDAVRSPNGGHVCQKRQKRHSLCSKGHYVNASSGECVPCLPNTFMPKDNHSAIGCINCRTARPNSNCHEKIIQKCNSEQPSMFACENGYFINHVHNSGECQLTCSRCTKCLHEGQSCHHDNDSVCCPMPDMEVIETGYGHECWNRSQTTSKKTTKADNAAVIGSAPVSTCSNNATWQCPSNWRTLVLGKCFKLQSVLNYAQAVESCLKQEADMLEEDMDTETYVCLSSLLQSSSEVKNIWLKQKHSNTNPKIFNLASKVTMFSTSMHTQYPFVCILDKTGVSSSMADTMKLTTEGLIVLVVSVTVVTVMLLVILYLLNRTGQLCLKLRCSVCKRGNIYETVKQGSKHKESKIGHQVHSQVIDEVVEHETSIVEPAQSQRGFVNDVRYENVGWQTIVTPWTPLFPQNSVRPENNPQRCLAQVHKGHHQLLSVHESVRPQSVLPEGAHSQLRSTIG